ncbi:MAG: SGNH/GDSL hydrolase family protein [Deltaproteobacteria bacterium]|nr:SGNH/GDSL hydrolase family protein [Deltaproteobacteria bacterium]
MKNGKLKPAAFKILAVALSLAAVLTVLEIAARTLLNTRHEKFSNRSDIYFSNPRGYHVLLGRAGNDPVYGLPYYGTPEGFRLPDRDRPDVKNLPEYPPNVLVLGDSFTFGRGVRYEDSYPFLLEKGLRKSHPKAAVSNRGKVGANISDVLQILDYSLKDGPFPLVIYGFVLNDFGLDKNRFPIVGPDFIDQNNGGFSYSPLRAHFALYDFLMNRIDRKRLSQVTTKAYLESFTGQRAEVGFAALSAIDSTVSVQGGRLAVALFPLLYDFQNYPFSEIHKKIEMFCREKGILLIDLLPAFRACRAEDLWVHPTDHHPNELGHKIAADEILRFLLSKEAEGRLALPGAS